MTQQSETDLFAPINGAGMGLPFPTMYTREQIVEMVGQHEQDMQGLVTRMEGDFDRYHLTSHVIKQPGTGEILENYAVYTSAGPRTFADKVISWLVMSELMVRAPHLEVGEHEEDADNLKERFAIGCLESADERLRRMLQPALRGQLAFNDTVRGGYIGGRCLLVKREDGTTYVDITAWDPMHIHWRVGSDGLRWVCYKIKKTSTQIKEEFGVEVSGSYVTSSDGERGSVDAEKEGIEVYDFYDGIINWVFTDGEDLKPPTPHGSPRVPAYLVLVGPVPLLQSDNASNLIKDVGESIFAGAREIYDKYNDVMSIFLEIVERARRQTIVMESASGTQTLPEDPFVYPTMLGTRTGDKVYTLTLQEMARETMAYVTQILGEIQRQTLPFSAYGETPFQLSGFAITQLRQATETVLFSRVEALEAAYLQISNLLYDQFMTGAFEGIQLSGRDSHRAYFSQMITPQMLQGTCDYTVKLVSQLPQDDMAKWATAQMAAEGKFLSRQDILDNIIGLQDSKQAIEKVKLEMAEQGLPEAIMYDLGSAAAERGDMVTAQLYLMEYMRIMAMKMGIIPPAPTDQGGGGGQSPPAKGRGQRPEVLPRAATGAPPPTETSNQGPSFVAPGTPRPGAQGQPG